MTIGFIGLGQLGEKLARNLLKAGKDLVVHDITETSVKKLSSIGARAAESISHLSRQSDVVITCLPSPVASAAVMAGPGGALYSMKAGSTWIEMSTTSVAEIKKVFAFAKEQQVNVLEAPLTGGVHRAITGDMTILVGGDEIQFKTHLPLLQILGGEIIYMGEIGNASLIKVITNLLCLVDLVAAGEALMLAKKGGLDLAKSYEAICASSGTSREFEDWAPVILNGSLNTGFTTDLGLKDLGFVADLGEEYGIPLKLTNLVKQLFEESKEIYGGDAWTPHVIKMLEEQVGEKLRAEGFPAVIPGI